MQFPQTSNHYFDKLKMAEIEHISNSKVGQNRRYLQLQPGKLDGNLTEIKLDGVILLREQLNASVQIEGAPPENFFPLAIVLGGTAGMRFCGSEFEGNNLLQATGSEWSVRFNENIDYVGCILDKAILAKNTECLRGHSVLPQWFVSRACRVQPETIGNYQCWLRKTLLLLEQQPTLLQLPDIRRMLSGQMFQLVINMLCSTQDYQQPLMPQSRRLTGVHRVVDFLKTHASHLPTMAELCTVAQLSERSLEYGFKEQFGVTPVRYVKLVRLNGVRQDLSASDPKFTKVVDIALRWGFVEFGRFAGEYSRLFKELPSHTLRQA
ncbi:MAG: helix-turn-helix domain-containing protein [Algicola sp.]|nr:helix-turn-helix domain-containing protein [Algicola sp.]